MTLQSGQETIAMHNILRTKDNQVIKFGQLIEYQTQKTNKMWWRYYSQTLFQEN